MSAMPGAARPALSTTPVVLVASAASPPPVTSVQCVIDTSGGAGVGITLPQNTDAVSFGTYGQPAWGLEGAMTIRLSNIGPCACAVLPFAGDKAPAVTVIPAFQCWEFLPSGSSNSWAAVRQW